MRRREIRKRKKKKHIFRWVLLLLTLLGASGTYYVIDQYKKGVALGEDSALQKNRKQKGEVDLFNGAEPKFGEINVLLLGTDARHEESGRSDTLMVANYNQETESVRLISIMRDTYVNIPGYGMHKINAAYALGGPELVRQTLQENFQIDVHSYAIVDFKGFPKIVDLLAPDGIEVNIPYKMEQGIYMTLEPGVQRLNGEQLLGYVRFRHDAKSDFGRIERQQEVLSKLKDEAVSVNSLMSLPKLLGATSAFVETNVDYKTMLSIAKGLLDNKEKPIETLRVPIDQSYTDQRISGQGEVLAIDLEQNRAAIYDFLNRDASATTNTD